MPPSFDATGILATKSGQCDPVPKRVGRCQCGRRDLPAFPKQGKDRTGVWEQFEFEAAVGKSDFPNFTEFFYLQTFPKEKQKVAFLTPAN